MSFSGLRALGVAFMALVVAWFVQGPVDVALYAQAGATVELAPSKDNTLFEDAQGRASNGAGPSLFAGRTGDSAAGAVRRALIAFDVAGTIPEGSTITGAKLTLSMSRSNTGVQGFGLKRVLSDWGEGDSKTDTGQGSRATEGDATWVHTFFSTSTWENPGGDFVEATSASSDVGGLGSYAWSSDGMIEDVQAWLDDPSGNFGWVLIGSAPRHAA